MAKIRRRKKVTPPAPPGGYGKGGVPQIGDDSGFWLAAGETSGTPNAQQASLWNNQLTPALNTVVQTIMVETPRQNLQGATAPTRSRLVIDFIDGSMDHYINTYGPTTVPDAWMAFVGIYVGEYVSATNLYDVQDPSNAADISREWLYVEGRGFCIAAGSGSVALAPPTYVDTPTHSVFNLTGAVDVVLEGGEALMLAYGTSQINTGQQPVFMPNIRLHFAEPT